MKILNIEEEHIADFVRFFPTMVKFGVPVPAAAWAISAGVPFRKNAIDMAVAYLEKTNSPNLKDFREWLAKLDWEDLHYKFGLEGIVLEDFSRMLSRSNVRRAPLQAKRFYLVAFGFAELHTKTELS